MPNTELENVNPNVFKRTAERALSDDDYNDDIVDPFDEREIFGKFLFYFAFFLI